MKVSGFVHVVKGLKEDYGFQLHSKNSRLNYVYVVFAMLLKRLELNTYTVDQILICIAVCPIVASSYSHDIDVSLHS